MYVHVLSSPLGKNNPLLTRLKENRFRNNKLEVM